MFRTLTVMSCLFLVFGLAFAQTNPAPPPGDPQRQFLQCLQRGDIEQAKGLLAKDPGLLERPIFGVAPVAVAMQNRQLAMMKYLIQRGVNIQTANSSFNWLMFLNAPEVNKLTPLHMAAMYGVDKESLAFLLDQGLDVNARTDGLQLTPLYICCAKGEIAHDRGRLDAIDYLLAHGADPNAAVVISPDLLPAGFEDLVKLPGFGTPMMWTTKLQWGKELEALLLRYHAEPLPDASRTAFQSVFQIEPCLLNLRILGNGCYEWQTKHNNLLPDAATIWQEFGALFPPDLQRVYNHALLCPAHPELVNAYGYNAALSGIDPSKVKNPSTVLVFADCRSQDNLIRSLDDIDAARHDGGFIAVFLDWHVAYLRAKGMDKIVLKPEIAPLPRVGLPVTQQLREAIGNGDLAAVQGILGKQPELLNQSLGDPGAATPIGVASSHNRVEVMQYLIAQGANLHPEGTLPLMHYAVMGGGEAVALLAGKGVDVNTAIGDYREAPLHLACLRGAQGLTAVAALLAHGANPNAAMGYAEQFFPPEMQACVKLPGFGTPLMWTALLPDSAPTEQLLLKYHATPLPPASREAFRKAYTPYARRNDIRSITICWLMLTQKAQEVMPKADTVWQQIAVLMPNEMKRSFDPAWKTTYGYNAALFGLKIGQVKDPSKVVVFAECKSKDGVIHSLADLDTMRSNGQCLVAFMDGHVQYIPAAEIQKLVLKP